MVYVQNFSLKFAITGGTSPGTLNRGGGGRSCLLAIKLLKLLAIVCGKIVILPKFDIWWPLVTSILTWPENDLCKSLRSRRGPSNAPCLLSLSSVVFEIRLWSPHHHHHHHHHKMNLSAPAINRVKELDIVLTKNNAQISSRPGMRRMRRGETFGRLQLWLRTQEYVVHVAYKFGIWLQERRKRDATSGTLDKDRAGGSVGALDGED